MDVTEFKSKYPMYKDEDNEKLAEFLYTKYYSNRMSREEFNAQFLAKPTKKERPWHKDTLLTAANIIKLYPVADLVANTAYNMFVTLPMQMGGFVGGAATDIGEALVGEKWDLDKARKAFEDIGTFIGAEPITPEGRQLAETLFGTLEEGARKAGEWVTDVTDSPLMGATTYGALQVAPWILLGQSIRPKRIKGRYTPQEEVYFSKADFIEGFKEAYRNRDQVKMTQIKDVIDKHGWTNTAEITDGTVIRLPKKVVGKPMLPMVIDKIEEPFHVKFKIDYNRSNEFRAVDTVKEIQKDINLAKEKLPPTEEARLQEYLKKKQQDKIFEEKPLEEDLFDQDIQSRAREVVTEELLHKKDKTFTTEYARKLAKEKDLNFEINQDTTKPLVSVSDALGNEWAFAEVSQANKFMKEYTGHYAAAEKAYYEAWNETFSKALEFAKEEIRPKKPTYRKFIDKDSARQQIDDAVPPKPFESLPPIDIINMELYTKDITKMTREARIGTYEEVTGRLRPEKIGFSLYVEPLKTALSDIDARTGLPFYQLYLDTQHGMRMEVLRSSHYLKKIHKTKSINLEGQERIYSLLEQKGIDVFAENYSSLKKKIKADKTLQKKFDGLTQEEFEAARLHRAVYNEAGPEFGIPMSDMILDYAPRMKEAGMQSWDEAYNTWKIPEFKWAAEEQRSGYLMPHERNIHRVTSAYVLRGARRKYLAPSMTKLENLYEKHARDPKELVRLSQPEARIVEKYIEDMRGWPTGFDTAMKVTANKTINFINKLIPKERYENIEYRKTSQKITTPEGKVETIPTWEEVGRKPGYFPSTENTINKLLDLHMSLSYSGAMGYRPVVVIRNMTQSMLGMPIVGPRYWLKGVAKALTHEGMAECKAGGILMDDYLPVGGEVFVAGGAARTVTRNSLWGFRKADSFNRAANYWAMKYKVQDLGTAWLAKLKDIKTIEDLNKSTNQFINDVGLDFFHRAVIESEVIPLLRIKDINGLSQRMGKQLATVTQYAYKRANSPYWMKGKLGRVAGQFGTWPTWYIDYMRALKKGSKVNAAKRISTFVGQGLLLQEIGKRVFGVDIKKWALYHPIFWTGGIAVGALGALKDLATGTEYDKARAKDRLKKVGTVHIPGSNAAYDLLKAREEDREEDQWKRGLGFKPTYEK